jgi:hypothetical protein
MFVPTDVCTHIPHANFSRKIPGRRQKVRYACRDGQPLEVSPAFAARLALMTVLWSAAIGCFLGFVFGVGCALAVMYSIYLCGYRAAVKDALLDTPPERLLKIRSKLSR